MSLGPTVCDHKGQNLGLSTCSPWGRSKVEGWSLKRRGLDGMGAQKFRTWSLRGSKKYGALSFGGSRPGLVGLAGMVVWNMCNIAGILDLFTLKINRLIVGFIWTHLQYTYTRHSAWPTWLQVHTTNWYKELDSWSSPEPYSNTQYLHSRSLIVDLWLMFLLTLPTMTLARLLNGQVCSCLFNTNWTPRCVCWLAHPLPYTQIYAMKREYH